MSEQRSATRKRIFKAGTVEFNGSNVDCIIRNISEGGAAFEVAKLVGIPHEITLNIPTQHVRRHSYIVWRKEKRMGVAFA